MKRIKILLFALIVFSGAFSQNINMLTDLDKNILSISDITTDFVARVALGQVDGVSSINKFGETSDVDTGTDPQDIWSLAATTYSVDGGTYTFSTTADIDRVSSSDAGDVVTITVIGLDENWEQVTQTVTLTGQTPVELTTPLIRVFRAFNSGSVDLDGIIYVFVNGSTTSGVPDDLSDIRAAIVDGENQTEMAIYTVPAGKTALFVQGYVGLSRSGATTTAEFTLHARPFGGVFQTKGRVAVNSGGSSWWTYTYGIPALLPEKTDIKIRCAEVSANNTGAVGGFDLLLFDNEIWGL